MKGILRILVPCLLAVVFSVSAVVCPGRAGRASAESLSASPQAVTGQAFWEFPVLPSPAPEAGRLTDPVTAELSITINKAIFPLAAPLLERQVPNARELLDSAAAIVDNFSLRGTWDGTSAQLSALLKDQPLATAAVLSKGGSITLTSDLLPSQTIIKTEPRELLRNLYIYPGEQAALNLDFTLADLRTLESAGKAMIQDIDRSIAATAGAEESGDWTFEGKTFSSRQKLGVTIPEIAVMFFENLRNTVLAPDISALLARFGADPQVIGQNLDREAEYQGSRPSEELPELEAFRYTNAGGDAFTDCVVHIFRNDYFYDDVTGDYTATRVPDTDIFIQYGTVGGNTRIRFSVPARGELNLTAASDGSAFDAVIAIDQVYLGGGSYGLQPSVHFVLSGRTDETGARSGAITLQVFGQDVVTLNYGIRAGEKIAASFDTTGKKIGSLDIFYSYDFSNHIRNKLLEVVAKVNSIMPEEMEKIMNLAFSSGLSLY